MWGVPSGAGGDGVGFREGACARREHCLGAPEGKGMSRWEVLPPLEVPWLGEVSRLGEYPSWGGALARGHVQTVGEDALFREGALLGECDLAWVLS